MYELDYVYPALKSILQTRALFRGGVQRLLETCRAHCRDAVWDKIAVDYDEECKRLIRWYSRSVGRMPPPDDIEVIWIAPHDVPTNFNLRGSSQWSRDPDDWQWFYHDDYCGPAYESELVATANELTDDEFAVPKKRRTPANDPHAVVEFLYSLAVYGLCFRELVRSVDQR